MTADFAPKLADVLTIYSRPVQAGDHVVIRSTTAAEPLVEALMAAVLKRGGHPSTFISLPNQFEIFMQHANEAQMAWVNPVVMNMLEEADVLFTIIAEHNTHQLGAIAPDRLIQYQQGQAPLAKKYLARCRDDDLRWNITAWPTQGSAQEANMGYMAYREFMYRACGLHHPDPITYWMSLRDQQDRLIDWLRDREEVRVIGPGINLSFSIAGRSWINCHGVRNFPDGEIFTTPVEDSVNGQVSFNLPTIYGGREVSGVTLHFNHGIVVDAVAEKGEEDLTKQLDLDEGARRLGEFAIGTNYGIDRFSRSALYDEKIGGTVHMALGETPGKTGGTNTSTIHWDMVHDMRQGGKIYVDDQLLYENGRFNVLDIF